MKQHSAKINLFLAVHGQRPDHYHNLFSLALLLQEGDQAELVIDPTLRQDMLTMSCNVPGLSSEALLPLSENNSMMKALQCFRNAHPIEGHCHIHLLKQIPWEAGFGGGSSNAAFALTELNLLLGSPLSSAELQNLGKTIGADVPLFLRGTPTLMEGIGDVLSPPPIEFLQALENTQCLAFKPAFGISTPEAYAFLRQTQGYTEINDSHSFLDENLIIMKTHGVFTNDFLRFTEAKYPLIPAFLKHLSTTHKLPVGLSGSGSGCFAILPKNRPLDLLPNLIQEIQSAFGEKAFHLLSDWKTLS